LVRPWSLRERQPCLLVTEVTTDAKEQLHPPEIRDKSKAKHAPPLLGSTSDVIADPTAKTPFSNQFNGMCPSYAG
jgi:hypothetical protein